MLQRRPARPRPAGGAGRRGRPAGGRRCRRGPGRVIHLAAKVERHRAVGRLRAGQRRRHPDRRRGLPAAGVPRLVHVSSPSVAHAGAVAGRRGRRPGRPGARPRPVRAEQGAGRASRAGRRTPRARPSSRSGRTWSGAPATRSWSAGSWNGPGRPAALDRLRRRAGRHHLRQQRGRRAGRGAGPLRRGSRPGSRGDQR